MQTVNKEMSIGINERIMYVGFGNNDMFNTNGFLAIDDITRTINLGIYEIEKYRNSQLHLVPNTLKPAVVSQDVEMLRNSQIVIKLILDSNFKVVSSECIGENEQLIENILTDNFEDKISGIYPGIYKAYQKDFNRLSEANIFFLVKQVIQKLENTNFKNIQPVDNNEKLEWEYTLDFCLAHLTRFGVEQRFNFETKRMEETESFKAWYKWWYEYFDSITEDKDLSSLLYERQRTCQDLSMFRPAGSFKNYINTEKSKSKTKSKVKSVIKTQEKVS